ncbi:MAG: hypothetical protein FD123_1240 [Bacteroidetes bacterium]|nr:MAG: hypothetical protein FD123_1240 [Bacteroidota bacterium]
MRLFFFASLLFLLQSCTVMVPAYEPGDKNENGTIWIHADKDTLADFGLFIDMLNDKPAANAVFYCDFEKLSYYKEVDVSFEGFRQDSMDFRYSEVIGSGRYYFRGAGLANILPDAMKPGMKPDSGQVSIVSLRRYDIPLAELPEKLKLKYRIVTQDTTLTGTITFVKTEREVEQAMRFH